MDKVSVIIPFKNDFDEIDETISCLLDGINSSQVEMIIVNDGSKLPSNRPRELKINHPSVRVINNPISHGVGFCFDLGVSEAVGDIVVLMGADVLVRKISWLNDVVSAVKSNPNTIGCSASVGLSAKSHDIDREGRTVRYGANLLVTLDVNDLPEKSVMRKERPNYTSLFKAKWLEGKLQDEPYEIPCLLGAFYFTSKRYYQFIGGFDTRKGVRYCGHKTYGHLEPYLSLKSWLVGGGCTMYPNIEAGHIFSRTVKGHKFDKGARGAVDMWWNALFINETMVLDAALREKISSFPVNELNLGIARKRIRQNYDTVLEVRKRNETIFAHDLRWFLDKWGYKLKPN